VEGIAVTPAGTAASRREVWAARLDRGLLAFLYAIPLTVTWTVAGAHIALGAAAALGLAHGCFARRWPLARTAADAAFVAFALAACLAVLFALEPTSDPMPLKKLLLIPSVHLAASTLATPARARAALRLLVAAVALTAAVTSTMFLVQEHAPWDRLRSTTHYMTLSGLLLLAWPMAANAAWRCDGGRRRLYVFATMVLTLALGLTLTRSAWLGMVVAAIALLARQRRRWLAAAPVALAAGFALLPVTQRDRLVSSLDWSHHSQADRFQMWRAGFAMWRHRPLTGVGLGDLQSLYFDYAPAGAVRPYGHLHNNWVQVLASMGGIGLLAFAWLMLQCGRVVHRAGQAARDGELAALCLGAWGSFWGFQTMGLFEWNFGDVEVTIAFYFLLGALAAAAVATPPGSETADGRFACYRRREHR
jgi:O-antigen ligase